MLAIHIIRTEALNTRKPFTIENAGDNILFDYISQPDPDRLKPLVESLESKVNYDPTGDAELDRMIHPLTLEELSNIEKHRMAWRRVIQNPGARHLILEDDALLLPEFTEAFKEIISAPSAGGIQLICIAAGKAATDPSAPVEWLPIREFGKILPSKAAYFIDPERAKIMLEQTQTYKFSLRYAMSRPELAEHIYYSSKLAFLDGSKVGLYPSSLHPNNILIFNKEYMEMWEFLSRPNEEVMAKFDEITAVYKKIAHLKNPDTMHLFGILQYKSGKLAAAEETLTEALHQATVQKGMVNAGSDMLNNLINLYEFIQADEIAEIRATPSKYAPTARAIGA